MFNVLDKHGLSWPRLHAHSHDLLLLLRAMASIAEGTLTGMVLSTVMTVMVIVTIQTREKNKVRGIMVG